MTTAHLGAAATAAGAVVLVLWRRKALGRRGVALALVAALALAVYATGVLALLPDPQPLIERTARTLGRWAYALVGSLAFLETGAFVGFLVPGEFTVILGGVVAGEGDIGLAPLLAVVWLCTFLGDTASFFLGRRLGRGFLLRHGPRLRIDEQRLEQVERYLERYGAPTIAIGRFASFVRTLGPFVVGTTRLPYRRFLPASLIGTALWSATFCVLGYLFYRSFSTVAKVAGEATLAFAVLLVLGGLGLYLYRRRRQVRSVGTARVERGSSN